MSDNPYAPPESPTSFNAEPVKPLRGTSHFLVLLAFGGYCLAVEHWVNAWSIKDLISDRSVPPLPILCFLAGTLADG